MEVQCHGDLTKTPRLELEDQKLTTPNQVLPTCTVFKMFKKQGGPEQLQKQSLLLQKVKTFATTPRLDDTVATKCIRVWSLLEGETAGKISLSFILQNV